MNLLYVANIRFPSERAHSIQIVKMCNAFAAQGHKVTVAVTNRPTEVTEDSADYYGEALSFTLQRIAVFDAVRASRRAPRLIKSLLYAVQRLQFAWKVNLKEQAVVYGRDPLLLWFLLFRTKKNQKIIYESHEAHYNFFVRRLFAQGVKVVVISEGIRDFYTSKGEPVEHMLVAHDGIDDSFLSETINKEQSRQRLGLPLDKKIAMYIGGFDAWKGIDTFFAASELAPEILFVAIGGSADEVQLKKRQHPNVLFLGNRPYRELRKNQRAADVLVVPNTARNKLSAEYTSPLKIFAHMASGVPLLVSNIPSLRTILGKDAATFFDPDDSASLSEQAKHCVAHDTDTQQKAEVAYQKSKTFTWSKRAEGIITFVQ